MERFAIILTISILPAIAACKPVLDIESQNYTAKATACIYREARAIAGQKMETQRAAATVIKRCHKEVHSKERALIASYPDFAGTIREQWKTVTAMRLKQAARAVMRARTSRS